MSKSDKIRAFDPNGPAKADAGIFGLPFTCEEADIVLVPVPWEVTTSYGSGTSRGPELILEASMQVDLHHPEFPELWKKGIAMDAIPTELLAENDRLKMAAQLAIQFQVEGGNEFTEAKSKEALTMVNTACEGMNTHVEARIGHWLDQGKQVGLVGGDHSTPLGMFRALAKRNKEFGILHIDAHMDLRNAYEGFTFSHASILRNAMDISEITQVVQVGIRDNCAEEQEFAEAHKDRISVFHNRQLTTERFEGRTWAQQVEHILSALPEQVHITFDIDGLDPKLCPNTGTPVPGGLQFDEATYLLSRLAASGRKIIGFDLVEVSDGMAESDADAWDANVGARMLFHFCGVLGVK